MLKGMMIKLDAKKTHRDLIQYTGASATDDQYQNKGRSLTNKVML
jgi:hypothetical protein